MSVDTRLIEKGVYKLMVLLVLLIISPLILNISFKVIKRYTDYPEVCFAYTLLALGIFLILFTVYFAFKTFKTFLDALFNNQ